MNVKIGLNDALLKSTILNMKMKYKHTLLVCF